MTNWHGQEFHSNLLPRGMGVFPQLILIIYSQEAWELFPANLRPSLSTVPTMASG